MEPLPASSELALHENQGSILRLYQARIVSVLRESYGLRVQPAQFWVQEALNPRYFRLPLLLAEGESLSAVEKRERELALEFGKRGCSVYPDKERVWVQFEREEASVVRLASFLRAGGSPSQARPELGAAAIGLSFSGQPLSISVPRQPHLLIVGASGSGKSVLQRVIITSAAFWHRPRELSLLLFDGKGGESFDVFGNQGEKRLRHLIRPVVHEIPEMLALTTWLLELMERRQRAGKHEPLVWLVLDELADLITLGGASFHDALKRLLWRGRSAGIHVIAATAKADSKSLGQLPSFFKGRIVLSTVRPSDSFMAANAGGSRAERLAMGGDMLVGQNLEQVQGFFLDDEDVKSLLANSFIDPGPAPTPAPYTGATSQEALLKKADPPRPTGRPKRPIEEWEVQRVVEYLRDAGEKASKRYISRVLFKSESGSGIGFERVEQLLTLAKEQLENERKQGDSGNEGAEYKPGC